MGGWSKATSMAKSSGGGGTFLRFEDGDRHRLVVLSDPHVRYTIWDQEQRKSVDVGPGEGGKPRFVVSVWNVDEGKAQVWEMSGRVFEDVAAELGGGDNLDAVLTVKRSGTGKDTRYAVMATGAVQGADAAKVDANRNPHDLWEMCGAKPIEDDQPAVPIDEEPF